MPRFWLVASSLAVTGFRAGLESGTVLITGANRGIGLEMARQFSAKGFTVIGTARKPADATDLKALDVQVVQLDVTDADSLQAMATILDVYRSTC